MWENNWSSIYLISDAGSMNRLKSCGADRAKAFPESWLEPQSVHTGLLAVSHCHETLLAKGHWKREVVNVVACSRHLMPHSWQCYQASPADLSQLEKKPHQNQSQSNDKKIKGKPRTAALANRASCFYFTWKKSASVLL